MNVVEDETENMLDLEDNVLSPLDPLPLPLPLAPPPCPVDASGATVGTMTGATVGALAEPEVVPD
jgi:hypothetical protein